MNNKDLSDNIGKYIKKKNSPSVDRLFKAETVTSEEKCEIKQIIDDTGLNYSLDLGHINTIGDLPIRKPEELNPNKRKMVLILDLDTRVKKPKGPSRKVNLSKKYFWDDRLSNFSREAIDLYERFCFQNLPHLQSLLTKTGYITTEEYEETMYILKMFKLNEYYLPPITCPNSLMTGNYEKFVKLFNYILSDEATEEEKLAIVSLRKKNFRVKSPTGGDISCKIDLNLYYKLDDEEYEITPGWINRLVRYDVAISFPRIKHKLRKFTLEGGEQLAVNTYLLLLSLADRFSIVEDDVICHRSQII